MNIYINGTGLISAQKSYDNSRFLDEINEITTRKLECDEPVYKDYINPMALRRMSKIMKRGVAAAMIAISEAGIDKPDAIVSGTSLGCVEDTEVFLKDLINNKETLLTPTAFIQSTHNTINSQIAILLKCNAYNFTHSNRAFSFENALFDARIQLTKDDVNNVLAGGFDEITEDHFKILGKTGIWRENPVSNLELIQKPGLGTIAGQGSAFFVLSKQLSDTSYCEFKDVKMYFEPYHMNDIILNIKQFVQKNLLEISDIDAVLLGYNGDEDGDRVYNYLVDHLFDEHNILAFKHLSGEYQTASGFALWAGAKILKLQNMPEQMIITKKDNKEIKNLLIYNHYNLKHHSVYLLSQC